MRLLPSEITNNIIIDGFLQKINAIKNVFQNGFQKLRFYKNNKFLSTLITHILNKYP